MSKYLKPLNILIGISLIINAFLISYVIGLFAFLFFLSIIGNGILISYIRFNFSKQEKMIEDVDVIFNSIEGFSKDLESLYEMELYYGDQTIKGLILHSYKVINDIVEFNEKYELQQEETITEGELEEEEELEEGKEEVIPLLM